LGKWPRKNDWHKDLKRGNKWGENVGRASAIKREEEGKSRTDCQLALGGQFLLNVAYEKVLKKGGGGHLKGHMNGEGKGNWLGKWKEFIGFDGSLAEFYY
jgi:hypothetical protein